MNGPAREQWLVLERIALGIVVLILVSSLVSRAIGWDWLMDTLFLAGAVALVLHGLQRNAGATEGSRWPLLVCGYLCVDSVFLFLVDLRGLAAATIFYLVLSGLYGRALQLRMRNDLPLADISLSRTIFAPASRVVSGLSLLALLCMALPMTQVFRVFSAWSGPMVVTFHTATVMDAGHTVRFGGMVAQYGYQVAFGHPVCLVLIGLVLLPVLQATGLVQSGRGIRFVRGALVAVLVWWVFFARGFQSLLGYPATVLFVAAVVALAVLVVRRPSTALQT